MRPSAVPADFASVTRGDLTVTIDDEGETRIQDVYVVSAPVAGRLQRIELDVGDEVVAGKSVLALFQPQDPALLDVRLLSEAEAGVGLAEADGARTRAELDYARRELTRAEALAKNGTISAAALDRARLAAQAAKALADQAAAALGKRRADLRTARAAMTAAEGTDGRSGISLVEVRAPVNGQVLRRIQESAGILAAGTPLLEIGDPAKLEIVTDLLSTDAVKVKPGNEVIIDDWGGSPLKGVVRRVEPFGFTKVSALGVEEQRVNVIIDFTSPMDEWRRLGHGYRVMTRIVTQLEKDAVKVPVGALFRRGDEWAAFLNDGDFDGGKARLVRTRIGARNTIEAQVLDGVPEGGLIIVYPSDQVRDGVRVGKRP
jgi:HlyD family secretion protein